MGTLYHRPDGHILAFLPDGGRDEEFEEHLRTEHIPFRRRDLPNDAMPKTSAVNAANNQAVQVHAIHEHVYRVDTVNTDDGGQVERHFLHHRDGGKRVFQQRTLRNGTPAPAAAVPQIGGGSDAPKDGLATFVGNLSADERKRLLGLLVGTAALVLFAWLAPAHFAGLLLVGALGMALDTERPILTFTDVTAGRTGDIRNLQLGLTVVRYKVRFTGTYTQGNQNGALNADSPYGFIKNVQFQLGGASPLRNTDSRFLKFWNQIQRQGVANNFTAPSIVANAATSIVAEFFMDMAQPDMIPGLDRAYELDTREQSTVSMIFDWGAATDIATSPGTAATVTSPQVVVSEVDDPIFTGPSSRRQITKQQYQSAGLSSGDNDMQIAARGPAYRAIVLSFRSAATDPNDAAGDDTFANTISLIGDNNFKYIDAAKYQALQQENKATYNMQGGWPAGWVILDYAKQGTLRQLLVTRRVKNPLTLRVNLLSSLPANPQVLVYLVNDVIVIRKAAQGRAAGRTLAGVAR